MYRSKNYYYVLKMFLPRWMQIFLRRIWLRRKMYQHKDIWPIDKNTASHPTNWQGWPEGKKFALVLTHDVESLRGLERCRELMNIEESLGFRSSFNFVAGDYKVPSDLIDEMKNRGFEIGVHGFHHDGNLYRSRKVFSEHAVKIKEFAQKWGAVGFRSPSMYHNLDWIHDLEVAYDASTFDTDPFEPQPEPAGTIFPFWVQDKKNKKGYVELPYTLPQDFLLYILMQQKNINIWKTKLEWIAQQGGMALFITHPDYMKFDNTKLHEDEFPAELYKEFLLHIKEAYAGQYWHALPKDMARFWADNYVHHQQLQSRRKQNICMLAYSFYESDNRILRYAHALSQRGDNVDVIALKNQNLPEFEQLKGVNVYRIQKRLINEKSNLTYLRRLTEFLIRSAFFLTKKHRQQPYDLIHIHSVPDFEVFAALIPKLRGAKIILDIHDIVPEFYASKFSGDRTGFLFKLLVLIERLSINFSNHVIISNHIWYKTLISRSVKENKCTTVMNYPDEAIFYKRERKRTDDKLIMIYPGTLGWHQGLDIAIKAFDKVKNAIPNAEFHIYGRGTEMQNLEHLIESLNLGTRVFLNDPIPIDQIADIMADADFGIIPKKNDPFGGEAFSTKTLEFMSLGIPIVLSRTKIDQHYFNDSVVKFFTPDDIDDLAECILWMANNPDLRDKLKRNALAFVEKYRWSKNKKEYLDLVDSLISGSNH